MTALLASMQVSIALAAVPNDPDYRLQWHHEAIGMPAAWDFAKGSPTVKVAVLDSGIDLDHPDLKDRIWTNTGEIPGNGLDDDGNAFIDDAHGWDFVDWDADPNPEIKPGNLEEGVNHGTLVAGIIGAAGNNQEGVTGIDWNVSLMPLRVLNSEGSGDTSSVVSAIQYAVGNGARVINISFIGSDYSQILADALRTAYEKGVVIVAAAGNEGDTQRGGNLNVYPEYPVCHKGTGNAPILIGVSALDRLGQRSSFSNYGSDCISISAPGESIYTTQVVEQQGPHFRIPYGDGWAGSSLAAPIVAGAAALMISLDPTLTPDEVRFMMMSTADDIRSVNGAYGEDLGAGRIDVGAAILAVQTALLNGASQPPPPPAAPPPGQPTGTLIKSSASTSVYYLAADGKRYVFPTEKTYTTWFPDFALVRTVTPAELASYPIGGNVTYRPGMRLLKLQTAPEVYAVAAGGVLRHVKSEALAAAMFGPAWAKLVDDLPEAFFIDYRVGPAIQSSADYDPAAERALAPTVDADLRL